MQRDSRSVFSPGWWLSLWRRAKQHGPRRRRPAPLGVRQLETRLTPSLSTLASFGFGPAGASPEAGLVMDGSGNLYGTAVYGAASVFGTVFEVAHGSGTITTLASFNATDGAHPRGALIMDSGGN